MSSDSLVLSASPLLSVSPADSAIVSDFGKKKKKKVPVIATFRDAYELTGVSLGKGNFSTVLEVRDKKHQMSYAAKFVDKSSTSFDRMQVLGEIGILQACKGQDKIIQFKEYFEEDESMILIFEKLNGGPLMDHIKDSKTFSERDASLVVKDIATALKFLHSKGIVHRDIKPENILCEFKDKMYPVKLCDFNLVTQSRDSPEVPCSSSYIHVGTPDFLSPESARAISNHDAAPVDGKVDIWSLGVILHLMLCGTLPFTGNCGQGCWELGKPCEYCLEDLFDNIADGRIDFTLDVWRPISGGAKELLARMLTPAASERITAEKILSHPWIVQTPRDTPLPRGSNPATDEQTTYYMQKARDADKKPPASAAIAIPSAPLAPFSSIQGLSLSEIHTPHMGGMRYRPHGVPRGRSSLSISSSSACDATDVAEHFDVSP